MLPVSLYTPLYHHAMLVVVIGCAILYWAERGQASSFAQFNQVAMTVIGVGVLFFMGFRPVSEAFVDMPAYAWAYGRVQQGIDASQGDWLFDGLMRLCSPVLPVGGFFFVCTLIYVAPLAFAFWRVHGAWAFPVFLACLTAFSFWVYGVNGIRNGMATSVLILAFAFHDRPFIMLPLMAAAWGFHGAALLPAGAFLVVRYVKRTEIWLAFWVVCVALSLFAGKVGDMLLSRYNPFAWDDRVSTYILGSEGAGFRADFLAYSIIPVLVTLLLAAPPRARARRFVARRMSGGAESSSQAGRTLPGSFCGSPASGVAVSATPPYLRSLPQRSMRWSSLWKRSAMSVKGMGGLLAFQTAGGAAGVASTGLGHPSHDPRSAPGATLATRERSSAWGRLPWVQFLRADPFYARLVNTYLLTNALWVLVIHAAFSNRFAYLSWFMMPWVLLYPFVPGKSIHRPRTEFIAAILFAHYLFTYVMVFVVYPLRGGGIL